MGWAGVGWSGVGECVNEYPPPPMIGFVFFEILGFWICLIGMFVFFVFVFSEFFGVWVEFLIV